LTWLEPFVDVWKLGFLLVSLVLFALGVFSWRVNRKYAAMRVLMNKRANQMAVQSAELQKSNMQMEIQNSKLQKQREQLDLAFEELKELDNFKQGLMGMIVHDLKNPLNSILMLSQMPPDVTNLQMILASGRQMLNLVLNILDIQKFEVTLVKPQYEEVELVSWVKLAVEQVELMAKHRSVSIQVSSTGIDRVYFDPEMITRVLVNLLTNAIKYSPANGGKVQVMFEEFDRRNLRISVSDEGKGISPEHREIIFREFSQILPRDSGNVRSTGLGLTFCRMAVEAHKGQISVADTNGHGSTFVIELPDAVLTSTLLPNKASLHSVRSERLPKMLESDLISLVPIINRLAHVQFYETGMVCNVLELIQHSPSLRIQQWRREMELALFAGNENRFSELIEWVKLASPKMTP